MDNKHNLNCFRFGKTIFRFNKKLKRKLIKKIKYEPWINFLEKSITSVARILPHIEFQNFEVCRLKKRKPSVRWSETNRRSISVSLSLIPSHKRWKYKKFGLQFSIRRRSKSRIETKTLDNQEYKIVKIAVHIIRSIFKSEIKNPNIIGSYVSDIDENIASEYLKEAHDLRFDLKKLFHQIRKLSEQTYENNALTFGCIIEEGGKEKTSNDCNFEEFLSKKKYRSLSDGYYTAYLLTSNGQLLNFLDLEKIKKVPSGKCFFPEWCRHLVSHSIGRRVAFCLTRQGDILIFENCTLRFTYREGHWQYWNHAHIVNMLTEVARVQKVPKSIIPAVVRAIYRIALDISFRRIGGMLVLLRNRNDLRKMAREGDAIEDDKRCELDRKFDQALSLKEIVRLPRSIILELASLDGAIILNNHGKILAYGAVLEPRRRGKILSEEGSRTKAAKGASNYGLVVKVSSDGDITVFSKGSEFLKI